MFDQNKKYGILGLARSGIAAAYKIKELGGQAYLSDQKKDDEIPDSKKLADDFNCEFGGHTDHLLLMDEWIVSPGIPLTAPIIEKGRAAGIKMISELEFGFQIKAPDSKIIAVTGSNGKSTTASLIAHIISKEKKCLLAGNIGDAFCGFPIEKPGYDFIVLEVSSFQLDLIDTFKPDIALLLNITPDHLNRYDTFQDYALSKFRIFQNQRLTDIAILNLDDQIVMEHAQRVLSTTRCFSLREPKGMDWQPDAYLVGKTIIFQGGKQSFQAEKMQIKGPHNWANAMASILACEAAGISTATIIAGLTNFTSLPHRMQYVRTIKGVEFYNDSKATNTDSVRYALLTFDNPVRIIMGGSDKGEDFGVLTSLLQTKAIKVYVTGATSEKMKTAWEGKLPLAVIDDFAECIRTAFWESGEGDVVVLSPACASYDKFRNYEHRGETFINLVNQLAAEYEKA